MFGGDTDHGNREILYFYTEQGQSKADVTIYDQFGRSVKTKYNIAATIHTHPYTGPTTVGSPVTYATFVPSGNDLILASQYSDLKHYILTGNSFGDTLIEYDATGKKGFSSPPCVE